MSTSQHTWTFKDNLDARGVEDFWYDLTDGGYIKPAELLDDPKQIQKITDAIAVVQSFAEAGFAAGIFEEM
jgi:hypothetical protein